MNHQKPPANKAALALLAATAALAMLLLARSHKQPVFQPMMRELPISQVQEG